MLGGVHFVGEVSRTLVHVAAAPESKEFEVLGKQQLVLRGDGWWERQCWKARKGGGILALSPPCKLASLNGCSSVY